MVIKKSQPAANQAGFPPWSFPSASQTPSERNSYAEADLLRLSVFFRNNPVPIFVCSPDGDVIKRNPAAEKMLRQQLGLREAELLPANHVGLVQACLLGDIKEWTVEHVVGDRNSRQIFAITYHAVPSFKLVYLYIVDITEYRRAESDFLQVAANTLDVVKLAVLKLRSRQQSQPQHWRWHWGLQDFAIEQPQSLMFVTMDGGVHANLSSGV
jgi:hypothetical protein